MKADNLAQIRSNRVWLTKSQCDIEEFRALVERTTKLSDYPFAAAVESNVLVYDGDAVREAIKDPETRKALLAEWVEAMTSGPGVVAFKRAFADMAPIDRATELFNEMIAEQHATGTGGGDHFAKPGANDRIWNALEKFCLRDPEAFAQYYGNDIVALVSEAWLGPAYQTTSQVNCVNPGGAAQSAHRDYHLGFQSPEVIEQYPVQVHNISPVLTLQGAVAHCDMPLESGPTLYLPYSQAYLHGYLATGLPEFKAYFAERHVQLALEKGDAAFFNPALFHGAGNNRSSNIRRMANLLQVSSGYGRAMESVDRMKMSARLYPTLQGMVSNGTLSKTAAANAIASTAEGYSFPTNLDRDPPIGGLAPESQQALFHRALDSGWTPAMFEKALAEQAAKKLT